MPALGHIHGAAASASIHGRRAVTRSAAPLSMSLPGGLGGMHGAAVRTGIRSCRAPTGTAVIVASGIGAKGITLGSPGWGHTHLLPLSLHQSQQQIGKVNALRIAKGWGLDAEIGEGGSVVAGELVDLMGVLAGFDQLTKTGAIGLG